MLKQLVKVANRLDSLGLTKEADALDREIIRLAAEGDLFGEEVGDLSLNQRDFANMISGNVNPNELTKERLTKEQLRQIREEYLPTYSEPKVVNIKTTPSSYADTSASPRPIPEIPITLRPEDVETRAPLYFAESNPFGISAKDLAEAKLKKEQAELKERQQKLMEKKQELKENRERIKKIITDVKSLKNISGDEKSLQNLLDEFEGNAKLFISMGTDQGRLRDLVSSAEEGDKDSIKTIISLFGDLFRSEFYSPTPQGPEKIIDPEQEGKNRINKLVVKAKAGDKEALKQVLIELGMIGDPVLNQDSLDEIKLKDSGWNMNNKELEELRLLLKNSIVINESDNEEEIDKKRELRKRLLKMLGSETFSGPEPQFDKNKFYLAKRRKGINTTWDYAGEYDNFSSAKAAKLEKEQEDTSNEYTIYDSEIARGMSKEDVFDREPQFVEDKFYLVKRIKGPNGNKIRWNYVAEFEELFDAETSEEIMEERDPSHEYRIYDGRTAKRMLQNKLISPTPLDIDDYRGMTREEMIEARTRDAEKEINTRVKFLEGEWLKEQEGRIERGEMKASEMPKMPNFRYDILEGALAKASPVSFGPSPLRATVDKIVQDPNKNSPDKKKETPSIIREKSKKNSPGFGSPQWIKQQEEELAKQDINAKIQAEVKKTEEAKAKKELAEKVKARKERKAKLEALTKAQNSPEQNSPAESSS